jgi:membrane protease YdiL (CAAX protease family)
MKTMTLAPDESGPQPWGIAATLAWLVLTLVISVLVAVAVYGAWVGGVPRELASTYDGVLVTIGTLASVPVVVAVLAMAARQRRWGAASYLALSIPRRGEIVMAVVCVIALVLVFNALLYVTGNDIVTPFQIDVYRSASEAGVLAWFLLAVVIFAPIGEEIAFRGFFFRGLARPGREIHAIVIVALAWSLLHVQYDWLGVMQIFVIGLVLGWFRWASGSTTITILMHVLINLEAMIETAIKVELMS